jgi:circadian clock protein KaiC
VVTLEQLAPEFGGAKRRMRVVKLRGRAYPGGWNDFHIERGGLNIFPRLQWERSDSKRETPLGSGIPELDQMLGGGVDAGTAVMMIGPTGTGKTTTIAQYVRMAADRNLRTAMFLFDERPFTMLTRLDGMDISIREDVGAGTVTLQQIEPAELTPSEFASVVKNAVEPPDGSTGASVVVIDSLNGYMLAMPEARFLTIHLHELLSFLAERNVFTFLTVAERGMIGPNPESAFDASYLADTVVNFRYFETDGEIQQTVSVVKRRTGNHERTLRKMSFGPHGIKVGQPLAHLHGILTGVPVPSASFE